MENEKKKNNSLVLGVFLVVVALCVGAYFYLKDKDVGSKDVKIQAISHDVKEVEGLDEILSQAKFVSDQKEHIINEDLDDKVNISVKIENQTIAIRTNNKSVDVTSIKNPVSVSTFYVGGEDSLFVDIYVLNKEGKLYHIDFASADFVDNKVTITEFALNNVVSYSVDVTDLEDSEVGTNFVVAKTSDGKYYTDYKFDSDNEYTVREIVSKGKEGKDSYAVKYGVLSNDVNPFSELTFNKRVMSEDDEIDFDSEGIIIKIVDYDENDNEEVKTFKLNIKNIKQVALSCMCGGCDSIYYLTSNGELNSIDFGHQSGLESLENEDFKELTRLVSKDVTAFDMLDLELIEPSTCGGQYAVFKSKDGKTYIEYGENSSVEISKLKRQVISDTFFAGPEGDNELYIISKDIKAENYLKDTKGNNLVAKKIYIFSGQEEDGDGESFVYLYILGNDNYLYYFEDYVNKKTELFSNSKVKSITNRDDDILVKFENNKEEVIDAYLVYETK